MSNNDEFWDISVWMTKLSDSYSDNFIIDVLFLRKSSIQFTIFSDRQCF